MDPIGPREYRVIFKLLTKLKVIKVCKKITYSVLTNSTTRNTPHS